MLFSFDAKLHYFLDIIPGVIHLFIAVNSVVYLVNPFGIGMKTVETSLVMYPQKDEYESGNTFHLTIFPFYILFLFLQMQRQTELSHVSRRGNAHNNADP